MSGRILRSPCFVPLVVVTFWAADASAANIACVGDSITYGYGLSDPDTQSYPARLQELLGNEHIVGNFGVSGATLLVAGDKPYRSEQRFSDSDAFAPDIVILLLGTNDSKPQNWALNADFSSDYHSLIEHYRTHDAVVYIATPPTVFEPGAFEISPQVIGGEVAPHVQQIASDAGAPLIDLYQATNASGSLFSDTVHPNNEGALLLAETVAAALRLHGFESAGVDDPAVGGAPSTGGASLVGVGGGNDQEASGGNSTNGPNGGAPSDRQSSGGISSSGGSSSGRTVFVGGSPATAETSSGGSSPATGGAEGKTASGANASTALPSGGSSTPAEPRTSCQFGQTTATGSSWLLLALVGLGSRRRNRRASIGSLSRCKS